jgi:putative ABC transport system substrate-binding protein
MRRRDFIAGLGSAAAWPLYANAQHPPIPFIGYLSPGPPTPAAIRRRLKEAGYDEGRNVAIAIRWGNNQGALAADLVHMQVAVIIALGGAAAFAAKAATSMIPIVFVTNADPVSYGFVASLSRPNGNMTGVALLTTALVGKQLDLLRKMVPQATTFAYLTVTTAGLGAEETTGDIAAAVREVEETTRDIAAAARAMNLDLVMAEVRNASDIESAFATLVQRGNSALVVSPYQVISQNMNRILGLASRHNIPAIYPPGWARRGGLMSYGAKAGIADKIVADYVVRILQGAKPADLPVQQPAEFDLGINVRTAKTLGLTVPPSILLSATEVIE